MKVAGLESVLAVSAKRPGAIRRLFLLRSLLGELGSVLSECAARHVPYRVVELEELERVAETSHHDGVCAVVDKKKPVLTSKVLEWAAANPGPAALLWLDGLKNPNNVGAIARSSAYFGSPFLLGSPGTIGLTAAALRVAQGGAEHLDWATGDEALLDDLRDAGFSVLCTSSHEGELLGAEPLPPRSVIVLGSENVGVSSALARAADRFVRIPGVGRVESLNVGNAASLRLWEHFRAHGVARSAPAPGATAPKQRR